MEVRYDALEKKNDFGMVVHAKLMVTGPFPCEIVLRGDYDKLGFIVEMENVGRSGATRFRLGTDDDHQRRAGQPLQAFQDRKTVHARHFQIEQDQVGAVGEPQRLDAVGHELHVVAELLQPIAERYSVRYQLGRFARLLGRRT
jgi:hypothetical protein